MDGHDLMMKWLDALHEQRDAEANWRDRDNELARDGRTDDELDAAMEETRQARSDIQYQIETLLDKALA